MVHETIDGTFRQTNLPNESGDYLAKREELRLAEIELMRLVGATAWFIRWPFVVEGAVTGACGACGAAAAVAAGYALIAGSAARALPFVPLPGAGEVALEIVWKLLVWGIVIGVTASLLAVRRYVRV